MKTRAFILLFTGLLSAQSLWAREWQVNYDQSKVGFIASYDEIPFEGRFEDFQADISFDPLALDRAEFKVNVNIASVNTDSPDRDAGMLEQEWFDTARYPNSTFTSTAFVKLADTDSYEVSGDLTIKSIARPVTLVFTWTETGKSVRLHGQGDVKRSDFDVGTGEWGEDDTIGFDVQIVFDLNLHE